MTLDIRQLTKNVIEKQFKISHLDTVEVEVFNKGAIPAEISASIQASYGETYLDDATYVSFFKTPGQFDKKLLGRLFNAVDSALGNDANRLADGDFKRLELGKKPAPEADDGKEDDAAPAEPEDDFSSTDDDDAFDIPDEPEDDGSEDDSSSPFSDEDIPDEPDGDSEDSNEDAVADALDEDEDGDEDKAEAPPPAPAGKTAVFLKITTK